LKVQLNPPALQKTTEGLEIDLSAIAKGYSVDEIGELLIEAQIPHFMVEIGGEVRTRGTNQDGTAWRIGLEAPDRDARRVASIVSLGDEAMATSGDYRNYFEHDGVTYSHTMNPHTGRPVSHQLASVTVIADRCTRADALATALLVMGPASGLEWAEQNSVKAMLGSRSGEATAVSSTTLFPTRQEVASEKTSAKSEFFPLFLATAIVFGIAIVAMSIGTIVANRRLQGSCGGMAGLSDAEGKTVCDMCTRPSSECSGDPDADIAAASRD
jgi:thiamine biosynthesis lipoprotein